MAKKATQTMEASQLSQMVHWLEEERRKDKAAIAALQEQTRGQAERMSEQSAQIQDLQATVAGLKDLVARAADFDQTAAHYKHEMSLLLDERQETWKKERAEAERLRKVEIEGIHRELGELDKGLQLLRQHEESLKARQVEEKRLNEVVQRLQTQISDLVSRSDDRVQAVTYLEEQRRSDNRRISKLEQETTDLRKKAEALEAKLPLLEDTIRKHKAHIDKAVDRVKDFGKTIDEARAAEFRREQKAKAFADQAEEAQQAMEEWRGQTQRFIEQYQDNKRALENLEGFQARLQKRQNEVAEMQRLAEDRMKRQWEEWQAAMDKELKRHELLAEERLRLQEKKDQEQNERWDQLEARLSMREAHLETLLETHRAEAHQDLDTAQGTIEKIDQLLAEGRSGR